MTKRRCSPTLCTNQTGRTAASAGPLVEVRGAIRHFAVDRRQMVRAVDGVDLEIREGTAVGLVGESGSGKTTLGRCLLRLIDLTSGSIRFEGRDITELKGAELRGLRSRMQMVFQDPSGSLDPRETVQSIVEEPLQLLTDASREERGRRVLEALDRVRLGKSHLERYPHQLSGGQQQRVGIARAMVTRPTLCVLDEPTSALDWVIRAEILDLLDGLRKDLGLSYLVISHDLGAVGRICDRIAVMYLGRIVEECAAEELFTNPMHPYTKALWSARLEPEVNARRVRSRLGGDPPSPVDPPRGCRLHPRCPIAVDECGAVEQELKAARPHHAVACMRVTGEDEIAWPSEWQPGGECERPES